MKHLPISVIHKGALCTVPLIFSLQKSKYFSFILMSWFDMRTFLERALATKGYHSRGSIQFTIVKEKIVIPHRCSNICMGAICAVPLIFSHQEKTLLYNNDKIDKIVYTLAIEVELKVTNEI